MAAATPVFAEEIVDQRTDVEMFRGWMFTDLLLVDETIRGGFSHR